MSRVNYWRSDILDLQIIPSISPLGHSHSPSLLVRHTDNGRRCCGRTSKDPCKWQRRLRINWISQMIQPPRPPTPSHEAETALPYDKCQAREPSL